MPCDRGTDWHEDEWIYKQKIMRGALEHRADLGDCPRQLEAGLTGPYFPSDLSLSELANTQSL